MKTSTDMPSGESLDDFAGQTDLNNSRAGGHKNKNFFNLEKSITHMNRHQQSIESDSARGLAQQQFQLIREETRSNGKSATFQEFLTKQTSASGGQDQLLSGGRPSSDQHSNYTQ